MNGLRMDVLKSMHAEAQRSSQASSTSSPAGNTAVNGASRLCQPLTSSPVRNSGQPFMMGAASTAINQTAASNSFQPTTSSPPRNSGDSSTSASRSAVSSQTATHVSTQPATSSPLRNSGVPFTIVSQSTASSQTAAAISAQQTPQVPPRNSVQLFAMSTAGTAPAPVAPQTQSSSSTVQGAVPTPKAPTQTTWEAFSFQNFRDPSAGVVSASGQTQNVQPQMSQQPPQQQQPQQQVLQQPPAASVSDDMDDVTPSPIELRLQQAPQQAQQPAPVFVQQAVENDDMDVDEAPKSPSVRPSIHPLRRRNSPVRLRNAIPRIQQARRIARGAITKAKHVTSTVKKSVKTVSESKDEALAKKLWKSFTSLADLDTHKGLKRAAKILLRMLGHARKTSVELWDVGVIAQFLHALPSTGADGVREFAMRIINLVPVTKERKDAIRAFNKTAPSLARALQRVDPAVSVGWVLNAINNALKPVYVAAAQLRFRMKAGEDELFDWDAGTIRGFEAAVGFLASVGRQANASVRALLGEVKYATKQIFALLFTGVGEVMSAPW